MPPSLPEHLQRKWRCRVQLPLRMSVSLPSVRQNFTPCTSHTSEFNTIYSILPHFFFSCGMGVGGWLLPGIFLRASWPMSPPLGGSRTDLCTLWTRWSGSFGEARRTSTTGKKSAKRMNVWFFFFNNQLPLFYHLQKWSAHDVQLVARTKRLNGWLVYLAAISYYGGRRRKPKYPEKTSDVQLKSSNKSFVV